MSASLPVKDQKIILNNSRFPELVENKIVISEFLDASKCIVRLVESLGRLFSPLSSDMSGNIDKLTRSWENRPEKFVYVEDLLLKEHSEGSGLAVDALLWLKRGLHFMLVFLECIVNDATKSEVLSQHMTTAYSTTLEPHHDWVTRKLFQFLRRVAPNRTNLLSAMADSDGATTDDVVRHLGEYLPALSRLINHIDDVYTLHGFNSNKAP